MKRVALLLLPLCAVLAGCATTANYAKAVNSWQGQSARSLLHVWGYPDHIQKMRAGHRLYIYTDEQRGQFPTVTTPGYTDVTYSHGKTYVYTQPTTVTGGGHYDYMCKTWFELNGHDKVVNTSFRGNGCSAGQDFVRQYSAKVRAGAHHH